MKIELSEADQELAKKIAKGRYENCRKRGIVDQKQGKQSNWQTDLEGAGSEIFMARILGCRPDTDTTTDIIPTYDLLTKKNTRVDVKSTTYETGKLSVRMTKKLGDCDVYVLVVGKFPKYRFAGWCYAEEIIKEENLGKLTPNGSPSYLLPQDKLRSL